MVYVLGVFISFGAGNENVYRLIAPQTVLSCIPCCSCCFAFTVTSNYIVFFLYFILPAHTCAAYRSH